MIVLHVDAQHGWLISLNLFTAKSHEKYKKYEHQWFKTDKNLHLIDYKNKFISNSY